MQLIPNKILLCLTLNHKKSSMAIPYHTETDLIRKRKGAWIHLPLIRELTKAGAIHSVYQVTEPGGVDLSRTTKPVILLRSWSLVRLSRRRGGCGLPAPLIIIALSSASIASASRRRLSLLLLGSRRCRRSHVRNSGHNRWNDVGGRMAVCDRREAACHGRRKLST
jgi:hypothetical protein